MGYCRECGKKESRKLPIDKFTSLCGKCAEKVAKTKENERQTEIDDEEKFSDIPFKDFKAWIQFVISQSIEQEVTKACKNLNDQVNELKTKQKSTEKTVTELTTKLTALTATVTELSKEHKDTKNTGDSNLKYLINFDRNVRKHNMMIFGLSERDDIQIEVNDGDSQSLSASTDDEKVSAIVKFLNGDMSTVSRFYRMGKEPGDKPRPIKVICKTVSDAQNLIKNSKNLKDLDINVYVKPDKTKKEAEEFKRIGARKAELLIKHPTTDPQNPIVKLEKGVLTVNGAEVDRYNPVQSLF